MFYVWKNYRLGIIGTGTLRHDFEWWGHRVRGKPEPDAKVGETANGSTQAAVSANAVEALRLCHNRRIIWRVFWFLVLWLRIMGRDLEVG